MEHRWHHRKQIMMEAQVNSGDLPMLNGKTKNMSMGGMFIQVETSDLRKGEILDVVLTLNEDGNDKRYDFRTCIVFKNEEGVGLMFRFVDSETLDMLEKLLSNNYNSKQETVPVHDFV